MSQPSAAEPARVLIVDDEAGVRGFVDRTLREAGYVTATAADGPDALRVAETFGAFDLLLTDLRMPTMNGDVLARTIRQRTPNVKVLYLTGFSDQLFGEKHALGEGEAFLDKPASVKGLLEAVSLLLTGAIP